MDVCTSSPFWIVAVCAFERAEEGLAFAIFATFLDLNFHHLPFPHGIVREII